MGKLVVTSDSDPDPDPDPESGPENGIEWISRWEIIPIPSSGQRLRFKGRGIGRSGSERRARWKGGGGRGDSMHAHNGPHMATLGRYTGQIHFVLLSTEYITITIISTLSSYFKDIAKATPLWPWAQIFKTFSSFFLELCFFPDFLSCKIFICGPIVTIWA